MTQNIWWNLSKNFSGHTNGKFFIGQVGHLILTQQRLTSERPTNEQQLKVWKHLKGKSACGHVHGFRLPIQVLKTL